MRLPTEVLTGQYKYSFDLQLMLKDVRQAKEFLKDQFEKEGKSNKQRERERDRRYTLIRTIIQRLRLDINSTLYGAQVTAVDRINTRQRMTDGVSLVY